MLGIFTIAMRHKCLLISQYITLGLAIVFNGLLLRVMLMFVDVTNIIFSQSHGKIKVKCCT